MSFGYASGHLNELLEAVRAAAPVIAVTLAASSTAVWLGRRWQRHDLVVAGAILFTAVILGILVTIVML